MATKNTAIIVSIAGSQNYLPASKTIDVTIPTSKLLIPFSTASDKELSQMLQAYYNNLITLDDVKTVWALGDKRTITLSSMEATGVSETHREQSIELQIIDFDHDILTTPINGKTKALITIDQKDYLRDANVSDTAGWNNKEEGYMNSTNINTGGWKDSARRAWCNNVYYNALPSSFKSLVKSVNKQTSAGNQSPDIITTSDNCFILSEIENFGSVTRSYEGEGSQYAYYTSINNRAKKPYHDTNSTSIMGYQWQRSPVSTTSSFCMTTPKGTAAAERATALGQLSIAMCL